MTTITRIATIQRQLRELGRIRLGEKGPKGEPRKLKTFRLTSASRHYIDMAAQAYGGKVTAWESPAGAEWQITIESEHLDVLVPPGDAVSQAYELWTGGGCQRRCDGLTQETGDACACPADVDERTALAAKGRACKPTTRLWVILPRLPDLGRWRLESHGYYAAVELAGMAEIASMATARGIMLPARLRIDQRRRKIPGQPTRDYIVPVLELPETNFGQLVASGHIPTTAAQIAAGADAPPTRPQIAAGKPARAPRPEIGPPPALPSDAAFTRAASPAFGEAPEPPALGGWPVEGAPTTHEAVAEPASPSAGTGERDGTPEATASPDGAAVEPVPPAAPSAATACGDEDASPLALGHCGLAKGHSGPVHKSKNGTWPR